MEGLHDNELMALYTGGSEAAFDELFRRHEARVYAYFRRRAASEAQARDLYQELFLKLHRFRDRYDPTRPFEPWLFQIARRVMADEWRRRRRRAEVHLDEVEPRSPVADAEHRLGDLEEAEHALAFLSSEQARILLDAKIRGLDHAEIAAALSKSVDAVKQTASRSLRRLRAAYAPSH